MDLPMNGINALEVMDGLETPPEGANIQMPFGFMFGPGSMEMRELTEVYGPEQRRFPKRQRIFTEVHVGNFSCQSSTERTPPQNDRNAVSRLASWRLNVVALSQRFNIYFAAYGDKIYVTVPLGLQHSVSAKPELIIDLPRTDAGVRTGGYINQQRPHCVNHLKIGNLGQLEILLMACDDGDVLVYYTHLLQYEIEKLLPGQKNHKSSVKPFLHENVGVSAWALAIHEKSRLIAVGSNFREVTLFLPGYTSGGENDEPDMLRIWNDSPMFSLPNKVHALYLDSRWNNSPIQDRWSNYKVRFLLGLEGHNIPSIDFASDENGDAQAILAADINGNLWTINIWDGTKKRVPRMKPIRSRSPSPDEDGDENEDHEEVGMGWGVLSLPLSYFKSERTPHEALGTPALKELMAKKKEPVRPKYIDITRTTSIVNESNEFHPNHPSAKRRANNIARSQHADDALLEEDDRKLSESIGSRYDRKRFKLICNLYAIDIPISRLTFASVPNAYLPWSETKKWMASVLVDKPDHPLTVRWVEESWARMERFKNCHNLDSEITEFRDWMKILPRAWRKGKRTMTREEAEFMSENLSTTLHPDPTAVILRTWNHDIQLLPSASNQLLSTICRGLVKQEIALPDLQFASFDRLNMLAVIPELSLVLIGSQIGRVALVTLTKVEDLCKFGAIPTCRLDLILPLSKHEHAHRPLAPLLGLAVGPVPSNRMIWRVMLHYLDHSILNYEVSRDNRDELVVI